MRNGVVVKYGDVAIGAKEEFVPRSEDAAYFVDFSQLKSEEKFPNYTNPMELYATALDETDLPIPTNAHSALLGWWSEQVSNENGVFSPSITLEITAAENVFTSNGITLYFDEMGGVFCNDLDIEWYRDDDMISSKSFNPNSAKYFCSNLVEYYNKLVITFRSINMPFNRLKLHGIDFGYNITFHSDEIMSVKIIQEMHPLSAELAINTCDIGLLFDRDIPFTFQDRQAIEVYFNGKLRSKTFVKDFDRKSRTKWNLKTEDYFGIMDTVYFPGGIYENAVASDIVSEIFEVANVPYKWEISPVPTQRVFGYIPYVTCREALMLVLFACGWVADTSNSDVVKIFDLNMKISQSIPLRRIGQGQKFRNETKLTAFELGVHKYSWSSESKEIYRVEEGGAGENIFVRFSEPYHDVELVGNGELLEVGSNYAIINASEGDTLVGQIYDHDMIIKTIKNPNVLLTDTPRVVRIENATLSAVNGVDDLANECYNYFVNTREIDLKIVEGRHYASKVAKYGTVKYGQVKYGETSSTIALDQIVNVGDLIETETEYLGTLQGRVVKQTYNLNGNIIIKDTVLR